MNISRETIEFRYDQYPAPESAGTERGCHLRAPTLVRARLDLRKFSDYRAAGSSDMPSYSLSLRFEPEA